MKVWFLKLYNANPTDYRPLFGLGVIEKMQIIILCFGIFQPYPSDE